MKDFKPKHFNWRLDGFQGAVLSAKLPHLDGWNASRRAHAAAYRAIHDLQPQAMVGLPVHFDWIMPARASIGISISAWMNFSSVNVSTGSSSPTRL